MKPMPVCSKSENFLSLLFPLSDDFSVYTRVYKELDYTLRPNRSIETQKVSKN